MQTNIQQQAEQFRHDFQALQTEIANVIVGYEEIVQYILVALFVGGHVLLEGLPGLGKTKMARTLAQVLHLKHARIQFTPDLMPSDILGTNIINEHHQFQFMPGPIFANLILADEINRATPKTQSALLECMQEQSVTIANTTYKLTQPFFCHCYTKSYRNARNISIARSPTRSIYVSITNTLSYIRTIV